MERRIKFRGWNNKHNKWLYGYYANSQGFSIIIEENYEECTLEDVLVNKKTVGQYTGLKDSTGKEIYEGDILSQGQDLLGVACISMRYGISVKKKTTTWSLINFVLDSDFDTSVLSDVEVVGNIHDNPELLKGGK